MRQINLLVEHPENFQSTNLMPMQSFEACLRVMEDLIHFECGPMWSQSFDLNEYSRREPEAADYLLELCWFCRCRHH